MPISRSLMWSLMYPLGVMIKISLKHYLAPYKLIKTFSSLKIIWIPIVSSNYGPQRALVYHRFLKFKFQCMYFNMQKFESSLWLLINFRFFNTCTIFFFFNGISPRWSFIYIIFKALQKGCYDASKITSKTHTKQNTFS